LQGAPIFVGERCAFEQVRTVAEGLFEGSLSTPAADGLVAAAGEDIGDGVAAEVGRTGVVGVVEDSAGGVNGRGRRAGDVLLCFDIGAEALEAGGVGVAQDSREKADDGVHDDGGSELAAGEDVVADGELAVAEELIDPLVDTLVTTAEEYDARDGGKLMRDGLGEGTALGGEEDDGLLGEIAVGSGGDAEVLKALEDRAGLEDHAFTAAKGTIVYGLVTVVGEGAKVVNGDGCDLASESTGEDTVAQKTFEESREDGNNIESHEETIPCTYGVHQSR
jgi:hypothetical protein